MASNSFGQLFRITTFGESHGPLVGVVIDGCPSGIGLNEDDINESLTLRQPGKNRFTSPRVEKDKAEIVSGIFEGKTTGAPITILIKNKDGTPSQYESLKNLYRPGHANFTYLEKYGIFDHRGGGRASARETAARVAAGAVAKKLLSTHHIGVGAYIAAIGGIEMEPYDNPDLKTLREQTYSSPIYCPDQQKTKAMMEKIDLAKKEGDSLGGIVACIAHLPSSLGDPIYQKLEAKLAFAMLSIPASKGFEIGLGFKSATMKGSEHNDPFSLDEKGNVQTLTNSSGGTLGGISTGAPLFFRVPFKPTSSIKKKQETITLQKEKTSFEIPPSGRHDPCVAIRAVPVVEAMTNLVIADALLMHKSVKM